MKQQAKETLMLYECIRLIPAAFQGRPPTASSSKLEMAPVHPHFSLNNQNIMFAFLFVCCRTYLFHYVQLGVGVRGLKLGEKQPEILNGNKSISIIRAKYYFYGV